MNHRGVKRVQAGLLPSPPPAAGGEGGSPTLETLSPLTPTPLPPKRGERGFLCRRAYSVFLAILCISFALGQGLPPELKNTQDPKDTPLSPAEALAKIRVPDGFRVTLFAAEPDVAQPINLATDARGRLWVAECYSYPKWDDTQLDRILIFEDVDNDGRHDQRTVFADKLTNLTSVLPGFGGVFALCPPRLLFFPDRKGDDVPDGPPVVVLDGFSLKAKHNIVNGLMWGPDGWLYGRHGITDESRVGPPGTPEEKRTRLNCSIWRFHPVKKTFEVVCHGTTNPWGLDFDEHGEGFLTNCVIGHLWHMVPGAHYQRMYGTDYNPYSYELIAATSDHLHWGSATWQTSRTGQDSLGGGHAHSGALIYQGDTWPREYRGRLFTSNLHGRRLNSDLLVRQGNSYVGKHGQDFLFSDDPWFRAIDMLTGPDGGVYLCDWQDLGECHDHDGVHRTSGRIFKVFCGEPAAKSFDLAKLSDKELVHTQLHFNDWHVRHARRLLQERAAAGKDMAEVHRHLRNFFDYPKEVHKLRALWALYVTGGADRHWLLQQTDHHGEHVRAWAVRLLVDSGHPGPEVRDRYLQMAEKETSGLVRLYLGSALQRLELLERIPLARKLAGHDEDACDRVQPLLIWYGLEPAVVRYPAEALELARECRMPKLRQFVARRLADAARDLAADLEPILDTVARCPDPAAQHDLLAGLQQGLQGRRRFPMPAAWKTLYPKLTQNAKPEVQETAHVLALLFEDPRAAELLRRTLTNGAESPPAREKALRALMTRPEPDLLPLLLKLVEQPDPVRSAALRALAAFGSPDVPRVVLGGYAKLNAREKQDALATLATRPASALAMLDALENKAIPLADVSAFTARQMQDLKDKRVSERLGKLWGTVRTTPQEKRRLIEGFKSKLTPDVLAGADAGKGRLVFTKSCAQCHRLFDEGQKIGPDLTGSNRSDLHYVLENVIDPSAAIGREYQLTNFVLADGRLISGIVVEETDRAVTVQTANDKLVLSKADVEERLVSPVSMMPENQIQQLSFTELRDLVAYLRSRDQVPAPK